VIHRSPETPPGDALVRDLFSDFRIPFFFPAPDFGLPMKTAIIQLLYCFDAFHELGKFLKLRPLVVRRSHRYVDVATVDMGSLRIVR
jgi:hypothetical protein